MSEDAQAKDQINSILQILEFLSVCLFSVCSICQKDANVGSAFFKPRVWCPYR